MLDLLYRGSVGELNSQQLAGIVWLGMVVLFAAVGIAIWRRDRDPLSPGVVVTGLFALYVLVLPGRYVLFGELPQTEFHIETFLLYAALCASALIGFAIGYCSYTKRRPANRYQPPLISPSRIRIGAVAIGAIGLGLVLIFFSEVGGITSYLSSGYGGSVFLLDQGHGELVYGFDLLVLSIILLAFAQYLGGRRIPWLSLVVAIPLVLFDLAVGNRGTLLTLVLAYLVLRHRLWRRFRARWLFAGGLVLAVGFVIFGHSRGPAGLVPKLDYAVQNFSWDWLNIFVYVGEFQAPALALWRLLETPNLDFQFGLSYLQTLPYLIPAGLFPGRPAPLMIQYLQQYDPALITTGNGLGFLSVAEAYWNFSVIGPTLVFLVFGGFWRRFYEWTKTVGSTGPLFYALLMPTMILMIRVDFADAFKATLFYVVPAALVLRFATARVVEKLPVAPKRATGGTGTVTTPARALADLLPPP